MSMTKAEKAALAAVQHELALHRAMRLDPIEPPDVPPPEAGSVPWDRHTNGWTINAYTGTIQRAWSKHHTHGWGEAPVRNGSASQQGIALYSTRLLALRALRATMARQAAEKLAKIDAEIASEPRS